IPVHWRVATDPDMDRIVRTGTAPARPEDAHSIHLDVKGLEPATEYYYQFEAASEHSLVGRTKTAPAAGTSPGAFEFAFASCQNYPFGYYTPHRHLAEEELDLVVHLGDYIYEGGAGGPLGRDHEPSTYCQTLSDYRTRYAQYKTDPALQAAHAACPWIVTWDDHEVVNNYADDEYRDVSSEALLRRRANAYQA
ncbi:alkaline phosphatase, partial [Halobacteriales archaeon QH_8_64_26]